MRVYRIQKNQFQAFGAVTRDMDNEGQAALRRALDPQRDGSIHVYIEGGEAFQSITELLGELIAQPN